MRGPLHTSQSNRVTMDTHRMHRQQGLTRGRKKRGQSCGTDPGTCASCRYYLLLSLTQILQFLSRNALSSSLILSYSPHCAALPFPTFPSLYRQQTNGTNEAMFSAREYCKSLHRERGRGSQFVIARHSGGTDPFRIVLLFISGRKNDVKKCEGTWSHSLLLLIEIELAENEFENEGALRGSSDLRYVSNTVKIFVVY